MKVEFEVEDSVYEFMTRAMLEQHGITLEVFLAQFLTHCVAYTAVDPEKAMELGAVVMSSEEMKSIWARITRRKEDA